MFSFTPAVYIGTVVLLLYSANALQSPRATDAAATSEGPTFSSNDKRNNIRSSGPPNQSTPPTNEPSDRQQQQQDRPLHIAAVSLPAYGHFMPVKGIAEAMARRGHRTTFFVENPHWCETVARIKRTNLTVHFDCQQLPLSNVFVEHDYAALCEQEHLTYSNGDLILQLFQHYREQLGNFIAAVEEVHKRDPFDFILTDVALFIGESLCVKLQIPCVSTYPLTMNLVVGPATYLPAVGTGYSLNMTTSQRALNNILRNFVIFFTPMILSEMNRIREVYQISPTIATTEIAGLRGLIFAPTIWGYDIAQPLCPNIVALGAFSPSVEHAPMEPALAALLDSERCVTEGAVYVNFGTLAVVGNATFERVRAALERVPFCVVWKVVEDDRRAMVAERTAADASRYFVQKRFSNPIAIMQHPSVRVFLTHCGDTSVLEAVQAHLPLAGIPFFADQADVCQRVHEAGMGVYVGHKHHFTVDRLVEVLTTVGATEHKAYRQRVADLEMVSQRLGGADRAADIIEAYHSAGLLTLNDFPSSCPHAFQNPVLVQEMDFYFLNTFSLCIVWYIVVVRLLGRAVRWIRRRCS